MPRLHLFEFEDQPWLPRLLRDYMTAWLDFMNRANSGWDAFAPHVASLLRESGSERIVDLGSGGGGPVVRIRQAIAKNQSIDPMVLLTDKYPNLEALERQAANSNGRIEFRSDPVDATDVPVELEGVRTMFCSFHHFRPEVAHRILADARDKGRAIGIFEATARNVPAILVTLTAPIAVLATTPFIRPFRWRRLIVTYLIPALPLLCLWDELVSCMRSYSTRELRRLVEDLESEGYSWKVEELRFPRTLVKVSYVIGWPTQS